VLAWTSSPACHFGETWTFSSIATRLRPSPRGPTSRVSSSEMLKQSAIGRDTAWTGSDNSSPWDPDRHYGHLSEANSRICPEDVYHKSQQESSHVSDAGLQKMFCFAIICCKAAREPPPPPLTFLEHRAPMAETSFDQFTQRAWMSSRALSKNLSQSTIANETSPADRAQPHKTGEIEDVVEGHGTIRPSERQLFAAIVGLYRGSVAFCPSVVWHTFAAMNEFSDMRSFAFDWPYDLSSAQTPTATPQQLTLSPQMLFVQHPTEFAFSQQSIDSKPALRPVAPSITTGSSQSRRRKSVSSTSSAPKRRKSESPASSPGGSVGSPEPSIGEQISQMSAAPFASGLEDIFSTPFGLETVVEDGRKECLACGYRYLPPEDTSRIGRGHIMILGTLRLYHLQPRIPSATVRRSKQVQNIPGNDKKSNTVCTVPSLAALLFEAANSASGLHYATR
ncbi:hypothetical protein HII31_03444, partial [Pseudocercospora fuligena]